MRSASWTYGDGAENPSATGHTLTGAFPTGFERCRAERLSGAHGVDILWMANADVAEQEFERTTPPESFVVVVPMDAQTKRVRFDGRTVRSGAIPEGGVNIERPAQRGEIWSRGRWESMFFFLPQPAIAGLCEAAERHDVAPDLRNPPLRSDPFLLTLAKRVRAEMATPTPFSRLRADAIAQDVMIHLLLAQTEVSGGDRFSKPGCLRGGLAPAQLRRACEAMDALLEHEITLRALATAAGCSPTHFSRAFKQSTGVPPFAWLLSRRVERAKDLLLERERPIAEIALEVGFGAQPQFTTAFRRVTGTTPGAWRKMHGACVGQDDAPLGVHGHSRGAQAW